MELESKILNSIQAGKEDEIHIEDILNQSDESDLNESDDQEELGGGGSKGMMARAAMDDDDVMPTAAATGPQTGPKGVLNDYKKFKLKEWKDKQAKKKQIIADAKKKAMLLTLETNADDEDAQESELAEYGDEEFMREYMEKRLNDLRLVSSNKSSEASRGVRAKFGDYKPLTAENFASFIDQMPRGSKLLVHIYKSATSLLHSHLRSLARQFGHARFCHLSTAEAPHLDHVTLPAILVYLDGDLQCSIFQFTETLTEINPKTGLEFEYSEQEVLRLLTSHNALRDEDYFDLNAAEDSDNKVSRFTSAAKTGSESDDEDY